MLVGRLETPTSSYLIEHLPCESYSRLNSGFVLYTVGDILRQLSTKQENFALFLTNAVHYMFLPGKILKVLYLALMQVTCIAHLHNCAM